ncbi:hypothetical protein ACOSQ4_022282 [Xanthoceras sorbifolium]
MINIWLSTEWQDKSTRNESNHGSNAIVVHTSGSIPMAKYRKEEFDRIGNEPSPFEFFKKLYSYKKDGGWASNKAEQMHKKMESQKPTPQTEIPRAKEWDIYKEVIGKSSHSGVLGLGAGLKSSDVFSSSTSTNCHKRTCLECYDEVKTLKEQIHNLSNLIHELQNSLQTMTYGSSPPVDNATEDLNVHIEGEFDNLV